MPLFQATGLTKEFTPGLPVLRDVSLAFEAGEIHALIGENGAGKSTFCSIVAGLIRPNQGGMALRSPSLATNHSSEAKMGWLKERGARGRGSESFRGPKDLDESPPGAMEGLQSYHPSSRRDAERRGVCIVTQELDLISTMTVGESLTFDHMPSRFGIINRRRQSELALQALMLVGAETISPTAKIEELGIAHRQLVEIARGLSHDCRLLILDEPTAALTPTESESLFERLEEMKSRGVGIVYISHRLEEVLRLSDRISVLRDGQHVETFARGEADENALVKAMIGRDLVVKGPLSCDQPLERSEDGLVGGEGGRGERFRERLESPKMALRVTNVRGVSFTLYRGEILGLAGLVGAGRTELLRAIFGADREGGTVETPSVSLSRRTPKKAVRAGIGLLTEDRKDQGLFLPLAIRANVSLPRLRTLSKGGWIKNRPERDLAETQKEALSIRCRDVEQAAGQLSGGNQQKVVLARWLAQDSDVLLFDEPTRGIDVGAKFEIYSLIRELVANGKSILIASSELNELLMLCDRILVMSEGKITDELQRDEFDPDRIMRAALPAANRSTAG